MKIYHTIEELSFLLDHISDSDLYEIRDLFPISEWVRAATYFLNGLPNNHTMIGKIVGTMREICWDFNEYGDLTSKQQIYLVANLLKNWQQISYEFRGYATM